ncbi:nucleotidyl cyclase domain-containing protein [Kineococcus sp. SYSU DK005]|uniref:hypothetical protein n=1 Tax=Kineococcus sp. SYSU DK005 TaxID=3383126 RepID=UPI003D7EBF5B
MRSRALPRRQRRLADALQAAVRLGREEFAVLLREVPTPAHGGALAQQVLHRVRAQPPEVGTSGGGATWPDDAVGLEGVSRAAGEAVDAETHRRRTPDVRTSSAPVP